MAVRKKTKRKAKKKATSKFKLKNNVRMEALDPSKVPRVRKELVEVDYINQLNSEELKWLAQFTNEYVSGAVEKDKNGRIKKGQLHSTKELAKNCYDMNNWRNNDLHSVTKANNLLYNIDQVIQEKDGWYVNNPELQEDKEIKSIDENDDNILSFEEFLKLKNNLTEEARQYYLKLYADRLK